MNSGRQHMLCGEDTLSMCLTCQQTCKPCNLVSHCLHKGQAPLLCASTLLPKCTKQATHDVSTCMADTTTVLGVYSWLLCRPACGCGWLQATRLACPAPKNASQRGTPAHCCLAGVFPENSRRHKPTHPSHIPHAINQYTGPLATLRCVSAHSAAQCPQLCKHTPT